MSFFYDVSTHNFLIHTLLQKENTVSNSSIIQNSLILGAVLALSACASVTSEPKASASLAPKSNSTVIGDIRFVQITKGVQMSGMVSGLKPNQEHGFHVHEKGDCSSPDGLSAGGHFNPESKKHGHHAHGAEHHAGDMPNLKADANGIAKFKFDLTGLTIDSGVSAIKGRAVIVHVNPDDYTSQPVGNAGGRIACGIIQ